MHESDGSSSNDDDDDYQESIWYENRKPFSRKSSTKRGLQLEDFGDVARRRRSMWWHRGYGGKAFMTDKEPRSLTVEASYRAYAELTSKGWLSSLPYASVVPLCALSLVMPGIMKQHRAVVLLLGYMFGEFGTRVVKTELSESCLSVHLSLHDVTTVTRLDVSTISKLPACLTKDGTIYLFKTTDQLCVYMSSLSEVHNVKEHYLFAKLGKPHQALKHTELRGTVLSATCGTTKFEVDLKSRQVYTF
jgi:hypothetical protein